MHTYMCSGRLTLHMPTLYLIRVDITCPHPTAHDLVPPPRRLSTWYLSLRRRRVRFHAGSRRRAPRLAGPSSQRNPWRGREKEFETGHSRLFCLQRSLGGTNLKMSIFPKFLFNKAHSMAHPGEIELGVDETLNASNDNDGTDAGKHTRTHKQNKHTHTRT